MKARDDIRARDATMKELDAKIAGYAEMIPKWERKMEDERRREEAVRKRQQDEEIARIQAMADEMVAEARREVTLERDAKSAVEFRLSQSFEAKVRAKETSAEMLEEETQKFRLMLPALQATNTELTTTVQRLRERETERMQVAIEAEKSANHLRRELADATAALQRADDSREQMESLLASSKLQCERERREHAEALDRMTEAHRRLEKECWALRLADNGGGDEDGGPGDGDRGSRLDVFDTVELTLIKEVQAAKRVSVDYRVKLSECQQQLHKIAQEWGGTRTLLQQREQLIAQLEHHLTHLAKSATDGESNVAATNEIDFAAKDGDRVEGAAVGGTSHAVLEVVSGQRDRLRGRVQELEEDVERLENLAQEAKIAASKAVKEQDALRQRLRYVCQPTFSIILEKMGIDLPAGHAMLIFPLLAARIGWLTYHPWFPRQVRSKRQGRYDGCSISVIVSTSSICSCRSSCRPVQRVCSKRGQTSREPTWHCRTTDSGLCAGLPEQPNRAAVPVLLLSDPACADVHEHSLARWSPSVGRRSTSPSQPRYGTVRCY
jgi:outer membrane murein-binding lipoprotein Lpp